MRVAASLIAVVGLAACPQERVFCEDGRLDNSLTFRTNGFVVDFDLENVIPYEDRAFEACTFIGGLLYGDGEVSDEQFPNLQVLGSMGTNDYDDVPSGLEVIPDELTGFNTVTDLNYVAGIRTISGFNNVVRANFVRTLQPTGFVSLEEVGDIAVSQTRGLESLRKGGNVTVFSANGIIPASDVRFPSLREVVGTFDVGSAGDVVSFPELRSVGEDLKLIGSKVAVLDDLRHSEGLRIGGVAYLQFNSSSLEMPNTDQYFRDWIIRNKVTAGGYLICGNGPELETDSVCDRQASPTP